MTNIKGQDLKGLWKTSKGIKVIISEAIEIPAQKVWQGILENGQKVSFTEAGRPLFNDHVGELKERKRGAEDVW